MLKLLPLSHFQAIYYYTHVIYICVHFLPPLIGIRRQNTNKHILLSCYIDSDSFILYLSSCETHLLNFLISIMTLKILPDDEKMTVHLKDFFKTSETHRSFCLWICRIFLVSIWLLQWFIFVLVLNFMKEKVCYFFIQLISTLYLPQHHTNKPWSKNFMDLYFLYETVIIHVSTVTVHSMSTKILAVIQLGFADIEFNSIVVFINVT